jgi:hypothetical protein
MDEGQTIIFATTVLGFSIQLFREWRNRKWDLEDRERARKDLEVKVTAVAATAKVANEAVMNKIDENTEISRGAFKEANNAYEAANHSKQQILELSRAIDQTYERRAAHYRRRADDQLQTVADETKVIVEQTQDKIDEIDRKLS